MRFKVDENLPTDLADALSGQGHDVDSVLSEGLLGAPDGDILDASSAGDRVLLTMDVRLADYRLAGSPDRPGIVLIRLVRQSRKAVLAATLRALPNLASSHLAGKIAVVSENRVRVRG